MVRKIIIISAVLAFTLTSLSYAQLPRGKWWKLDKVAKAVELSKEQVDKIEKVFMAHRREMIDLKADLAKERLDMESIFDTDKFDSKAAGNKIDKLITAQGKLQKNKMMFFVQIRDILTQEQFTTLKEKKEEFRQMRKGKRGRKGGDRMDRMKSQRNRMMGGDMPCPDPPCMDDDGYDDFDK